MKGVSKSLSTFGHQCFDVSEIIIFICDKLPLPKRIFLPFAFGDDMVTHFLPPSVEDNIALPIQ